MGNVRNSNKPIVVIAVAISILNGLLFLQGCVSSEKKGEQVKEKTKKVEEIKKAGFDAYKRGNWDQAVVKLKQVIEKNPNDINVRFQLGYSYASKDQLKNALKQYQEILRISKDSADAHYNIGRIYMKQNEIDKAIKEFETTIACNQNFTSAHVDLADAYTKKKNYSKALMKYDELIKTLKAETNYLSHIHTSKGNIYKTMGDGIKAKAEYETAIKLDKNNREAVDALGKLSSLKRQPY